MEAFSASGRNYRYPVSFDNGVLGKNLSKTDGFEDASAAAAMDKIAKTRVNSSYRGQRSLSGSNCDLTRLRYEMEEFRCY